MVLISKHDKNIWDKYASNLEKTILIPNKKNLISTESHKIKKKMCKINGIKKNITSIKKKRHKPDSTLDLHGYNLDTAKTILHKYLIDCYEKNIRNVLIITGKGRNNNGALKKEVPKWLSDFILKKLIISYDIASKNFGGDGALLLRIKNKYKKNN